MAEATGSPSAFETDDEIVKCFTGDELMKKKERVEKVLKLQECLKSDREEFEFEDAALAEELRGIMGIPFDYIRWPSKRIDCRIIDSKPLREGE